jgi:hypothetical protein
MHMGLTDLTMSEAVARSGGVTRAARGPTLTYPYRAAIMRTSLHGSEAGDRYLGNEYSMPTVLRDGPYRFYFYSHEPNEPPHVHVDRDDRSAKF